jgi:hypothetical protein
MPTGGKGLLATENRAEYDLTAVGDLQMGGPLSGHLLY